MEPVGSLEDGVEVEILGLSLGDGRMGTVVDDFRGTHRSARLCVIKSDAVASTRNEVGVYAVAAHGIDGNLTDFMLRKFADKIGIVPEICQTDSDIGFASSRDDVELLRLYEAVISFGRET